MILNVEILFLISNSGELSKSDSLADRANPHPSRLPAAEVDGEGGRHLGSPRVPYLATGWRSDHCLCACALSEPGAVHDSGRESQGGLPQRRNPLHNHST